MGLLGLGLELTYSGGERLRKGHGLMGVRVLRMLRQQRGLLAWCKWILVLLLLWWLLQSGLVGLELRNWRLLKWRVKELLGCQWWTSVMLDLRRWYMSLRKIQLWDNGSLGLLQQLRRLLGYFFRLFRNFIEEKSKWIFINIRFPWIS